MIFKQSFYDNFHDNNSIMFLFSLFIVLIFVSKPIFLCIFWLFYKLYDEMVVQITFVMFKLLINLRKRFMQQRKTHELTVNPVFKPKRVLIG